MTPRRRRWLLFALACAVAAPFLAYAGTVALFLFGPSVDSYKHRLPFESEAWRSRSNDGGVMWPTRLRMVDDLINSHKLDGLSKRKVGRLLGPPDETDKFRNWDLVYALGPERNRLGVDYEWLVIRFGPTGTVANYRVLTD